jgi:hypothetical protein
MRLCRSEKYFSRSMVSNKNSLSQSRSSVKKNLVQHYKKDDIIKNRISNTDRLFKNKRQQRVLPFLPGNKVKV